jgi:hypothetical protein
MLEIGLPDFALKHFHGVAIKISVLTSSSLWNAIKTGDSANNALLISGKVMQRWCCYYTESRPKSYSGLESRAATFLFDWPSDGLWLREAATRQMNHFSKEVAQAAANPMSIKTISAAFERCAPGIP